ncbi:outer membrane protein assembly factor BamB family protein [Roseitranquillus sediminis]|uniref:outer membrane protein assembly factor BamB family protein n=1 Tax=Roseitranquillus sediminis TaxID=2809051 RepID=UPI001D0CA269|nr:PQQ-binding-like beta-propeller repeat protein [Roseitranquillus sediminis]MBM9595464.1 PQQ-binding-like beta-propeller repeat protein [Roseitranquillus sediminis]
MTKRRNRWCASASALAMCVVAGSALANEDVLRLQEEEGVVVMPSITYNGWNYSPLDQINTDNVDDLVMKWTVQLGITDEFEAPPLIVNDTMYIITPEPNHVYALDLTDNGKILWEYRPPFSDEELSAALEVACCGSQTRGLNYAEGKLFMQTLGGKVIALDAETGEELWLTEAADQIYGETMVGNGIVIGDLYIAGNAGGEYGARGAVTAFDINTGDIQWKYYNMGPNNEVGITDRFQPFYADDQIENPALASWKGDSWKRGGGTSWGYFTYDPDLNMFYYSTGNCGPWNPDYRREWGQVDLDDAGGLETYRNNYCASQLARDATTGELIWAYNITPQDQWDLDEPLITPLVDLEMNGETRKVALKAARNGYFYVWDRETGEIVNDPWPFQYVDFMTGVDKETGRALYDIGKMMFTNEEDRRQYTQAGVLSEEEIALQEEEAALYGTEEEAEQVARGGTDVSWCPGIAARNWENDAYSPQTGLLYTATQTECRTMRVTEGEFTVPQTAEGYRLREYVGEPYNVDVNGNPTEHKSELQANDPVSGETVWRIEWMESNRTPILATAGNLVFQGGEDAGTFRAIDATNGDILWEFRTGTGFGVTPVTYISPEGEQHVAIIGSNRGADEKVEANAEPDAANRYKRQGSTLYVFGLQRDMASAN